MSRLRFADAGALLASIPSRTARPRGCERTWVPSAEGSVADVRQRTLAVFQEMNISVTAEDADEGVLRHLQRTASPRIAFRNALLQAGPAGRDHRDLGHRENAVHQHEDDDQKNLESQGHTGSMSG